MKPFVAPKGDAPTCHISSAEKPKVTEVQLAKQFHLWLKKHQRHTARSSYLGYKSNKERFWTPPETQDFSSEYHLTCYLPASAHAKTCKSAFLKTKENTTVTTTSPLVHKTCCDSSCPVTPVFTAALHQRANHAAEISNSQTSLGGGNGNEHYSEFTPF